MAKYFNLDKMSYAELSELREEIDAAMAEAKSAERKALLAKMEGLAAASGLSLAEVLGDKRSARKGSKIAVKYRNPKDSSQTWAGRGRQPLWLVAALKKGQKIDSFQI